MIDPAIARGRVKAAMGCYPKEFGLDAFPSRVFTIDETASFVNDKGVVMLYVFVKMDDRFIAFAKGSSEELWPHVVPLPGQPDIHIFEVKE